MSAIKKPNIETAIVTAVILPLLGVIALGIWVFTDKTKPSPEVAGEQHASIFEPQTYEAPITVSSEKFVFQYPKKFNVTNQDLGGGAKRILVESTEPRQGFEITVFPF